MVIKSLQKINSLLSKKQKLKFILLLFLLLLGMFLEILGLGILVPFLDIISNQDNQKINIYLKEIKLYFNLTNKNDIIFFFLKVLFIIYFFKTVYLIYLSYKQNKFLQSLNTSITTRLFNNFLNQDYNFHIERNSSELNKILMTDTTYFNTYCSSIIIILTESALFSSILVSVLIIEPSGSLFAFFVLLILSSIYYFFSKRKLKKWGIIREKLEIQLSKVALESLKGYRELIIFQKREYFNKIFDNSKIRLNNMIIKYKTLNVVPRFYLEFMAVIVLTAFILFFISKGQSLNQIIPVLGVFVAAIFKITPSINKIIIAFQNLKFYNSSINVIFNEFNKIITNNNNISEVLIDQINTVELKSIGFRHQGSKDYLFNEIDLAISKGETIGIVGKSGTGKTTLVDLIVGLHNLEKGEILINGVINIKNNLYNWRKKIAYVTQTMFLLDATLAENIAFGVSHDNINFKLIEKVIHQSNLKIFLDSLPNGLDTIVGEEGIKLSGGQRQRLAIARALYKNPEILIFDESTSSLDTSTENEIIKTIDSLKGDKIIFVVSHKNNPLKNCDRIFKLEKQKLLKLK